MLRALRAGGVAQVLMGAIVAAIIAVFVLEFRAAGGQQTGSLSRQCVAEVAGERKVRNPGGRLETRPVIRTTLVVAGEKLDALVNLTTRDEMTFRMLLGRRTVRSRFVVDPGRSYIGGRPSRDASA